MPDLAGRVGREDLDVGEVGRGMVAVAHPHADRDGGGLRIGRLGQQAVGRHVLDAVGRAGLEGHDPPLAAGAIEDLEVRAPVLVDVGIGVAFQDIGREPGGLGAPDLAGLRGTRTEE